LGRLSAARGTGKHYDTPGCGSDAGDPMAHRDHLFQQDEGGEAGDLEQVHDAAKEQQAHQEPAVRSCLPPASGN
jgi:hypothetical protein